MTLHVLSAGAAKGLVESIAPEFERDTGAAIAGTFGAVGAIRGQLLAGAPCDVIVLTEAMLRDLAFEQRIVERTMAPIGRVRTGIAVRAGDPLPSIGDADALRATFLAARELLLPDPQRATAGIHCAKVLHELGIDAAMAPRLRAHPNGAAAMRALAAPGIGGRLGCTQITEILYTPGVALAGPLPAAFELSTVYSAAVASSSKDVARASALVERLTCASTKALRARGGFEA